MKTIATERRSRPGRPQAARPALLLAVALAALALGGCVLVPVPRHGPHGYYAPPPPAYPAYPGGYYAAPSPRRRW